MTRLDTSERLVRVRRLMMDLVGPDDGGTLLTLVEVLDDVDFFERVFGFIQECPVVDLVSGSGHQEWELRDAEQLRQRVREVDRDTALGMLVRIASTTLAYGGKRHWSSDVAQETVGRLAQLLGAEARWWTNSDLRSGNPVTRYTFDALVIGRGGGVGVAVLAVDED
ncbi:MAG TPA: hypothetical protein VFV67_36330 [Actinophytocola sp.]|uniref:hypothetical protein n=1 Tax=Actinophytocola sp. TaxID=1872138 RepID=UPI002DB5B002|nr:hypothetical protein [Actinophytocola sp.]HEU5476126.1 hypothetical protein [Actinophytocola sp.]